MLNKYSEDLRSTNASVQIPHFNDESRDYPVYFGEDPGHVPWDMNYWYHDITE